MQAPLHLFNTTATPTTVAVTYDTNNSPIRTHSNGTAFACRINHLSEQDARRYGRLDSPESVAIYAASGHGLTPGERVTVGSLTYEVVAVENFDHLDIYDKIIADEVTTE